LLIASTVDNFLANVISYTSHPIIFICERSSG
jgi:hypothetical protein